MPAPVSESGNYRNITSTTQIVTRGGQLMGFYVNSTSAGVIQIKDGNSGAGTNMGGQITPAIGFHRYPGGFGVNGLLVTVVSGTIDITVFFQPSANQ